MPVRSKAKKQRAVIQWVARTMAVCRGAADALAVAVAELGMPAESAMQICYQDNRHNS